MVLWDVLGVFYNIHNLEKVQRNTCLAVFSANYVNEEKETPGIQFRHVTL